MPNYQKRIVYLSNEQRQELFTNGSITVGGQTIVYSDNDMYVTPQDEPYVKPDGGIPATDLASSVRTSLEKADTAYQKPSGGIPSTDLASGVIPSVPVQDVIIDDASIVQNGIARIPFSVDDTSGTGDTDKVWSADKSDSKIVDLNHRVDAVEIHETVSTPADILTITDGADDIPVDELIVGIEPVQDLHGYEYPWPEGGGKNKFDSTSASGSNMTISNGVFVNSNTDTRDYVNLRIQARNGTSVIGELASLSIRSTGVKSLTFTFDGSTSDNIFVKHSGSARDIGFIYPIAEDGTFTLSMNFTGVDPTTVGGIVFRDVQIESGASATSYAPYSNICPISGWTGANVTRTGFNQWDEDWEIGGISIETGLNTNSSTIIRAKNIMPAVPESVYYLAPSIAQIYWYGKDGYLGFQYNNQTGNLAEAPSNATGFRFVLKSSYGTTYNNDICVNLSDPARNGEYEPGRIAQYNIAFPSQAGTVYGGTLTINQDGGGSLVVDRAQTILSSSNSWNKIASNIYTIFRTKPAGIKTSSTATADGLSCDKFKCEFGVVQDNRCYIDSEGLTFRTASSYNNATEFLQDVGDMQVVYPLAETQTYTLTASQITTLLGTNNFLSNAGPINKLAYCADSKMYIDNKIARAVAAALNA